MSPTRMEDSGGSSTGHVHARDPAGAAIGRAFGGRNHTTVMHACKRTAARIAEDPQAYETVRRLTEQLGGTE